jgi:hypothetical protein
MTRVKALDDYLDLTGGSGRHYRYMASKGQPSPMGGNFALVRERPEGGWELIYVGETESLYTGVADKRAEAAAKAGEPLHLFTRLNISKAVRSEEKDDIIQGHAPRLNTTA